MQNKICVIIEYESFHSTVLCFKKKEHSFGCNNAKVEKLMIAACSAVFPKEHSPSRLSLTRFTHSQLWHINSFKESMRTHTHAHKHIYAHAHTRTHIHTHMYINIRMKHIHMHTYTHTCKYGPIYCNSSASINTYACDFINTNLVPSTDNWCKAAIDVESNCVRDLFA